MPPGIGSLPSSISLTLCLFSCGFCIDKTHGVGLGGGGGLGRTWEEGWTALVFWDGTGTTFWGPPFFLTLYSVVVNGDMCVLLTALFVTHLPSHFYVMWWSWFCGAVLVWLAITWWEFLRRFWWCLLKKCHHAPVELIKFHSSHCVDTA